MEYRRRRRKAYHRPDGGALGACIVMGVVFAAVVYLIAASRLGTWLARTVVAPAWRRALSLSQPSEPPEADAEDVILLAPKASVRGEITFPAMTCYALQIGVYSDINNANRQSEALREVGAAGHIVEDAGRYRVLAAGYPDLESMEKVRAQLSESGIASVQHAMTCAGRAWSVETGQSQLDILEAAASALSQAPGALYRLAIDFDKEGMQVAAACEALNALSAALTKHLSSLSAVTPDNAETDALYQTLLTLRESMDRQAALGALAQPQFSAGLKSLYLQAIEAYAAFTAGA